MSVDQNDARRTSACGADGLHARLALIDVAIDGAVVRSDVAGDCRTATSRRRRRPRRTVARGERGRSRSPSTERDHPATDRRRRAARVTALALRSKPAHAPGRRARSASAAAASPTARGSTPTTCATASCAGPCGFGAPQGACGTFDVKRRQFPFRKPKTGALDAAGRPPARLRDPARSPCSCALAITVRRVRAAAGSTQPRRWVRGPCWRAGRPRVPCRRSTDSEVPL